MLRQAVFSDVSEIQRIRRSVRENRLVSTSISDRQVRESIEKTGRGWVIESEGQVVAFAIGNAANGNVWALFVHPDFEGRGFGRALQTAMLDWYFRQKDYVWLGTAPGTRAEKFYRASGWREHGMHGNEIKFSMNGKEWSAVR